MLRVFLIFATSFVLAAGGFVPAAAGKDAEPKVWWNDTFNEVIEAYTREDFQAAAAKAEGIVRQVEKRDRDTLELVPLLLMLSRSYSAMGRRVDAENAGKRAVAIADLSPPRSRTLEEQGYKGAYLQEIIQRQRSMAYNILAEVYQFQNQCAEAEPLLKKAVEAGGAYACLPLGNLAKLYRDRGNFKNAEEAIKRSIALREKEGNPERLAVTIAEMGDLFWDQEKIPEAEKYYRQAIALLEKEKLTESTACADIERSLGHVCQHRGQLADAEKHFRTSIDILQRSKQPEAVLSLSLRTLADLLVSQGRYSEAEPLLQRAYNATANKSFARDNIFLDVVMNIQTSTARRVFNERFPRGTTDLDKTLADSEATKPASPLSQADFLERLAFAYPAFPVKRSGMIALAERAIAIRNRAEGPVSPAIADDKLLIASRIASLGGDYERPALEAYDIWKKLAQARDPRLTHLTPSKVRLAYLLAARRSTREKALDLANMTLTSLNPDNPYLQSHIAPEFNGLGLLYELMGEFGRAQSAFTAGLKFCRRFKDMTAIAILLTSRARASMEQNDLDRAWREAKEAEAHCLTLWGPEYYKKTPLGMPCMEVLASLARLRGDLDAAEQYARRLVAPLTWKPFPFAAARHNLELADVLLLRKQTGEATALLERCIASLSNNPNSSYAEEVELARAHQLLGRANLASKDYATAGKEFRRAWTLHLKDKSTNGVVGLAEDYDSIALSDFQLGYAKSAAKSVLLGCDTLDDYIAKTFDQLSLAEQCAFIKCVQQQIGPLLTLGTTESRIDESFQYVMRWQGLLIDGMRRRAEYERSGSAPLSAELRRTREWLSRASSSRSGEAAGLSYEAIQNTVTYKETLERQLSAGRAGANADPIGKLTAREFASLLADDEAFVDMLRYRDYVDGSLKYACFLVTKKSGVRLLKIGSAEPIDRAAANWLNALASRSGASRDMSVVGGPGADLPGLKDLAPLTSNLESALWSQIADALPKGVSKIWICPDGPLANLPWTLLVEKSAGDRYLLSQIDSPRAFAGLKQQSPASTPEERIVLAGGIKFARESLFLPGTQRESSAIAEQARSAGLQVTELTGVSATKSALLARLPQATWIHLATHGFFDTAEPASSSSAPAASLERGVIRISASGSAAAGILAARNPLLSSGLLVAPAQPASPRDTSGHAEQRLSESGALNDHLTAEELVGQDLKQCRLVVLSACNTGKGKTFEGQGVMGLRAAIIGAGARGVLMSLWPVDDEATRELMEQFYRNLWNARTPMAPAEALRAAQRSLASATGGKWEHPYYWAGWVFDGKGW